MKRILTFIFIFLISIPAISAQDAEIKTNAIFEAMKKEMGRTLSLSKTEPKIHFAAFQVKDTQNLSIIAARGGLVQETKTNWVDTDVSLRVGNKKEDNSFFEAYTFSQGEQQDGALSPDGVRAGLWAASDKSYKEALDIYSRKQGYKNKKNTEEVFDDFSPITPAQDVQPLEKVIFPTEKLKEIAQKTSAVGALKELEKFNTQVNATETNFYYLSSEDAKYTKKNIYIQITFYAKARTKSGFEFDDTKTLAYASLEDVPPLKELEEIALNFAKQIALFVEAKKGEAFIGPLWLENEASAEMFESTFIGNIHNTRKITYDQGGGNFQYFLKEFALKENLKVLPVNFEVIDDPLQKTFSGKKMSGAYNIDEEGAKAQTLYLVKNGILKDLPKTRSLIKGQKQTNGHAFVNWGHQLYATARAYNVFFFPHETTPKEEFKQKFMDFCKAEGLEYCYKITSKNITNRNDILAIKINAETGEETPVYGLKAPALNTRTLRDIKFAADDLTLYNRPLGASFVAPSVILSEAELTPSQTVPSAKMLVTRPKI